MEYEKLSVREMSNLTKTDSPENYEDWQMKEWLIIGVQFQPVL